LSRVEEGRLLEDVDSQNESGDASLIAALKALPLKAHRGKTFSLHRYCRHSNLFSQAVK